MKNKIKNVLATTGLSLILLGVVAVLFGGRFICVSTVFQTAGANLAIHAGVTLLKRFESKYFMVEIGVEIAYVLVVLMLFGSVFDWFGSTPPAVLAVMGILVYVIGCVVDIFQVKSDVEIINKQLQIRNEK